MNKLWKLGFIFVNIGLISCVNDSITPTKEINSSENNVCQPNAMLSALLLQLLLSMHQPQSQQNLLANSNPFLNELNTQQFIRPEPAVRTTLLTSTTVSTLTQLLPTVVSIWFRNERIPTTVLRSQTRIVTETITITSTFTVEPTMFRNRRDLDNDIELDPSFINIGEEKLETEELLNSGNFAEQQLERQLINSVINQPEVLDAWNSFVQVLHQATNATLSQE